MSDNNNSNKYCETYIPKPILGKLQSGAFEQLCEHLRERSDQVENIKLMTISGFCRNCLAKVCFVFENLCDA